MDDWQLLNEYATVNSEDAFRVLVDRYASMVYQAALGRVRNPHQAEEITQAVFIALARKAAQIRKHTPLSGWLFRATRFAALSLLREESRRQRHEQEAAVTDAALRSDEVEPAWEQISPYLYDALDKLSNKDRNAILIRFFEEKSHKELARMLEVSEDAAKVRVFRAVERLRLIFAKKGLVLSAVVLTAALSACSAHAAPAGLTVSVTAVALAKGTAGTASVLATAKAILKLMTWAKLKTAAIASAGVLLAAAIATVAGKEISGHPARHAYTVRGIVELQAIRYSTNAPHYYYDFETNSFEIYVKDGQWLVKMGSQRPEVRDYHIESSDGVSTYHLDNYDTRNRMRVQAGLEPLNVASGWVGSGNIPCDFTAPEPSAIWIAYASWSHFAKNSSSRERPVPFADYVGPSSWNCGTPLWVENAVWQLDPLPPHSPTTLCYFRRSENDGNPSPQETGAPQDFTNVVYEVVSSLDFAGLRLPRESVVSIYRKFPFRPPGMEDATNQLCYQIRVQATNIVAGDKLDSFQPKLTGRTLLSDWRFGKALAFDYYSEHDWLSEAAARKSAGYRHAQTVLAGTNEKFLANGTPAPEISLLPFSGNGKKKLSDYKGKVMVLEFWATWCVPCRTAMQELQTYPDKYPNWRNKVALLALSLDDDREQAAKFAQQKGWNRADNFWISHDVFKTYGFEGIPMVYIVNQRGEISAAGHHLNIPEQVNRLLGDSGH